MAERISDLLVQECPCDTVTALNIIAREVALAWKRGGVGLAGMLADYMSSPTSNDLHAPHPELFNVVVSVLQEGVSAGEIKVAIDAEFQASLVITVISVAVVDAVSRETGDIEERVGEALDSLLQGLIPRVSN